MGKGTTLDELQRLSLVSKICTELDNHLGLSDRTLAEFIIHLADEFPEPSAFRHALSENGAEFPDSLSDNLLRIIGAMKPASGGSGAGGSGAAKKAGPGAVARVPRNEKEARFPGLAMPNTGTVELEDGFGEVGPGAANDGDLDSSKEKRKMEVRHSTIYSEATAAAAAAAAVEPKRFISRRVCVLLCSRWHLPHSFGCPPHPRSNMFFKI